MSKILLLSILFLSALASCSTYHKTSVSLVQAVDKGRVKTETSAGKVTVFKNIEQVDNTYFGVNGESRVSLNEDKISKVYLSSSNRNNNYKVWVKTMNSNTKIKGYLYEVQDSSILISQYPPSEGSKDFITKIEVSQIAALSLRQQGKVRKGYKKGTLIGIGVGASIGLVGGIAGGDGDPGTILGFTIMGAGITGIIGSVVGLIAGSTVNKYKINGEQSVFDLHKASLIQIV